MSLALSGLARRARSTPRDIVRFRDRSQDAEATVIDVRATRRACGGPRWCTGPPQPRYHGSMRNSSLSTKLASYCATPTSR